MVKTTTTLPLTYKSELCGKVFIIIHPVFYMKIFFFLRFQNSTDDSGMEKWKLREHHIMLGSNHLT